MHVALEKLLQDIVDVADKEERHVNDLMIEFPMPPSNFLVGLEYGEAKNALYDLATALDWSYYNTYYQETCWLPKDADCIQKYRVICEFHRQNTPSSISIKNHYGDIDLAFKLARNETEGGIHAIIKTMVTSIKRQHIESNINTLIEKVWKPLQGNFEERLNYVRAYKERYAAFLPAEYLEEDDMISQSSFLEVLLNHYKLARRMKNLVS